MKHPRENSLRWLRQAEYDLRQAEQLFESGSYSYASFFAEQAAQKALKAFLFLKGKRIITVHSVGELAKEAASYEQKFSPLIEDAKRLDKHYLASRYPDALPEPAIPAESYVRTEAEQAIEIARKVFDVSQASIR
jgi:HEPN domain-containing protein